ncbi:hypothetical protein [Rhizobium sp. SAFR-030]|uniref:hypothetical protein n=1 Tax=Rhizobium sp. SAFR-030 TaxID=3387277 RepID=UPI003F7FC261
MVSFDKGVSLKSEPSFRYLNDGRIRLYEMEPFNSNDTTGENGRERLHNSVFPRGCRPDIPATAQRSRPANRK